MFVFINIDNKYKGRKIICFSKEFSKAKKNSYLCTHYK